VGVEVVVTPKQDRNPVALWGRLPRQPLQLVVGVLRVLGVALQARVEPLVRKAVIVALNSLLQGGQSGGGGGGNP
jgi:hypothetical protein